MRKNRMSIYEKVFKIMGDVFADQVRKFRESISRPLTLKDIRPFIGKHNENINNLVEIAGLVQDAKRAVVNKNPAAAMIALGAATDAIAELQNDLKPRHLIAAECGGAL